MSVQITDCTIRDGGYLFNKNSDPEFIKGIMKGLAEAGIDFVNGFVSRLHSTKLMRQLIFVQEQKKKDIWFNLTQWIL